MTITISMRKKLAALGVGAAVIVGTGGAVAWAQSSSPGSPATTASPATSTSPAITASPASRDAAVADGARLQAIARRSVHADLVVKDKDGTYVTITIDRGTVTAASATSITLDRPDGKQVTLAVTTDTKVRGVASVAALQTGKAAVVLSRSGTATQIGQRKA
jgi:hypothetical protein